MHPNHKPSLPFQLIMKWLAELFKNLIHIYLPDHTAFLDPKMNQPIFANVMAPQMPKVVRPLLNIGFKYRNSITVPGFCVM